jgi:hypothetical protein
MYEQAPAPVRRFDSRVWRTATWSGPLLVQVVLGGQFLAMLALGRWAFPTLSTVEEQRKWSLTSTACIMLASAVVCAALMLSPTPHRRALALSLAGSSTVVLIGAIIYAFWLVH